MIYLTGAAGFVGSNIACALKVRGIKFVPIDDLSFGDKENLPKDIMFMPADFNDCLVNGGNEDDILVHCATSNIIYAINHPVETVINNALNTIELFKRFKGKIVYTSTSSVYGYAYERPTKEDAPIQVSNAYDVSKRIAEVFLKSRGNYTTLRLSNVYGENQRASNPYCGVIGKAVDCAFKGKMFWVVGDGSDTRDYTYVGDVVEATIQAIYRGPQNTEINIGTGQETSIMEMLRVVSQLTGRPIIMERAGDRGIDSIKRRCLSIEEAKKRLGWSPRVHIGEGIVRVIQWYEKHGDLVRLQSQVS